MAERFEALVGYKPYRWQMRLYEALLEGEIYDALDLPTGLGKTSIIPLWLLARCAAAPLPRRLIYVVDRRAVVDQATAITDKIAAAIGPVRAILKNYDQSFDQLSGAILAANDLYEGQLRPRLRDLSTVLAGALDSLLTGNAAATADARGARRRARRAARAGTSARAARPA